MTRTRLKFEVKHSITISMPGVIDKTDPFRMFLMPPPDETAEQQAQRERKELEAQRVSDLIDEELKAEKSMIKKQQNGLVKVLLLGQSESGKSTALKNFRMKYARTAWRHERASWRAVIQLNVIRSILAVVETLQAEMDDDPITSRPFSPLDMNTDALLRPSLDTTPAEIEAASQPLSVPMTDKHQLLKRRLGPLRRVEMDLKKHLGVQCTEETVDGDAGITGQGTTDAASIAIASQKRSGEFAVMGWKETLGGLLKNPKAAVRSDRENPAVDDATEVIASCREDMKALWMDQTVRDILVKRRVRLQDSSGFFLDDLDRIATRTYQPSDDDVVRARLRTLGVQEYRIQFDHDTEGTFLRNVGRNMVSGSEWILYDVGGSRTMRHAWLPYFDNVNAIIFLAPVSCFDERLIEDPSVNRLEDSFLLWRAICSSKLLSKVTLIMFLNKCDLLKAKLKSGIKVKPFLPSFGERKNDAATVLAYLREKFKDILRQNSPEPRSRYFYATSLTDIKATAITLNTVRDSVLREHLKYAELM